MARTVAMWALAALFGLFAITIVYVHEAQIGGWFSGEWWAFAGASVCLSACCVFIILGDPDRDVSYAYDLVRQADLGEDPYLPKLPPDFVRVPPFKRTLFNHEPVYRPRVEPGKPDLVL
jgi:hypothetical protein